MKQGPCSGLGPLYHLSLVTRFVGNALYVFFEPSSYLYEPWAWQVVSSPFFVPIPQSCAPFLFNISSVFIFNILEITVCSYKGETVLPEIC